MAEPEGLDCLVARLGLDRFKEAGLLLCSAEVIDEDLRIHVKWPRAGDGFVRLERDAGQQKFCGTGRIALVLEGGAVTRVMAVVMRRIAASLGDATIEEVIEWLLGKARQGAAKTQEWSPIAGWSEAVQTAPKPEGPRGPGFPRPLREFFCDHAMRRKFFESFKYEGPSAYVIHGDLECSFITPRSRFPIPRFFEYPWPLQGEVENFPLTTDLGDLDVITGGTERLDQLLDRVVQEARGPVTVNTTCVPTIIGDDVESSVARHACKHGVFLLGPRTADPVDIFMRVLETCRDRILEQGPLPRPGTVALVGFREERARDELVQTLGEAGVDVVSCILPAASEARLEAALSASVLVFRPSAMHQPLYDRLFAPVQHAVRISPPAPWGIEASLAWVEAVAEAAGRGEAARGVIEKRLQAVVPRLALLRARASEHTIAFVLDPDQEDRVLAADSQTGLPVVQVLLELGFKVRILVAAGDAARFRDTRDRIGRALAGVEVLGFLTEAELKEGLLPAGAVFSEFFYDHRVTRAGKGIVSARAFEMGVEGGLRTMERLVRIASLPFFRTYRAWLGRGSHEWWVDEGAG